MLLSVRWSSDEHGSCLPTTHIRYFVTIIIIRDYRQGFQKSGASQVELGVKNPPANAGDTRDMGSIPESGRTPGGGHGNPLQYSCLENPVDREAWRATVHRVTKSQTRLKQLSMQAPEKAPPFCNSSTAPFSGLLFSLPSTTYTLKRTFFPTDIPK